MAKRRPDGLFFVAASCSGSCSKARNGECASSAALHPPCGRIIFGGFTTAKPSTPRHSILGPYSFFLLSAASDNLARLYISAGHHYLCLHRAGVATSSVVMYRFTRRICSSCFWRCGDEVRFQETGPLGRSILRRYNRLCGSLDAWTDNSKFATASIDGVFDTDQGARQKT